MGWTEPKTNWAAGAGIKNTDLNRIENNIKNIQSNMRKDIVLSGRIDRRYDRYNPVGGSYINISAGSVMLLDMAVIRGYEDYGRLELCTFQTSSLSAVTSARYELFITSAPVSFSVNPNGHTPLIANINAFGNLHGEEGSSLYAAGSENNDIAIFARTGGPSRDLSVDKWIYLCLRVVNTLRMDVAIDAYLGATAILSEIDDNA